MRKSSNAEPITFSIPARSSPSACPPLAVWLHDRCGGWVMLPLLMVYIIGFGPALRVIREPPKCDDCGAVVAH